MRFRIVKLHTNSHNSKIIINFAVATANVPIVQWIEYWIPVPTIGVRLPMGIQSNRAQRLL